MDDRDEWRERERERERQTDRQTERQTESGKSVLTARHDDIGILDTIQLYKNYLY